MWPADCLCLDFRSAWPTQLDIFRVGMQGRGHFTVCHVVAADMVCVQANEVGNHSVFSINSNHKALEAWKMNLFLPVQDSLRAQIFILTSLLSLQIHIFKCCRYCLFIIALSLVSNTAGLWRKIQYLCFIFSPAWLCWEALWLFSHFSLGKLFLWPMEC